MKKKNSRKPGGDDETGARLPDVPDLADDPATAERPAALLLRGPVPEEQSHQEHYLALRPPAEPPDQPTEMSRAPAPALRLSDGETLTILFVIGAKITNDSFLN